VKFRKKPIIVKAYQTDKEIIIETLEGSMKASVGDWIITGVSGEQYPCKPDIFEKTYEKVEEDSKRLRRWFLGIKHCNWKIGFDIFDYDQNDKKYKAIILALLVFTCYFVLEIKKSELMEE
jgi:hypothetical protein